MYQTGYTGKVTNNCNLEKIFFIKKKYSFQLNRFNVQKIYRFNKLNRSRLINRKVQVLGSKF